jgi:hypothetical protein
MADATSPRRLYALSVLLLCLLILSAARRTATPVEVGNQACASCHQAISESYARTAMARTSGPAPANVIEGTFHHAGSDVSYRVYREGKSAFLSSRPCRSVAAARPPAVFCFNDSSGSFSAWRSYVLMAMPSA